MVINMDKKTMIQEVRSILKNMEEYTRHYESSFKRDDFANQTHIVFIEAGFVLDFLIDFKNMVMCQNLAQKDETVFIAEMPLKEFHKWQNSWLNGG